MWDMQVEMGSMKLEAEVRAGTGPIGAINLQMMLKTLSGQSICWKKPVSTQEQDPRHQQLEAGWK